MNAMVLIGQINSYCDYSVVRKYAKHMATRALGRDRMNSKPFQEVQLISATLKLSILLFLLPPYTKKIVSYRTCVLSNMYLDKMCHPEHSLALMRISPFILNENSI